MGKNKQVRADERSEEKVKKARLSQGNIEVYNENEFQETEFLESIDKLRKIHGEIREAVKRSRKNMYDSDSEADENMYDSDSESDERITEDKITQKLLCARSKIIETIPHFWLTAFLGHYALGLLLSEEDQKIFRFLKSVNVEHSESGSSGRTITFNFAKNPYFQNESLTKTKTCGCTIEWKDEIESLDKGGKRGYTNASTSFFTWFADGHGPKEFVVGRRRITRVFDEVAGMIIHDFWPNAVEYYLNGNFTDEDESAILEDFKMLLSGKD